jgi:hypothetical protein
VEKSETNTETIPTSYVEKIRADRKKSVMARALNQERRTFNYAPGKKKQKGVMARDIEHPEHGPMRVLLIPKRAIATPKNDEARISAAEAKRARRAAKRVQNGH